MCLPTWYAPLLCFSAILLTLILWTSLKQWKPIQRMSIAMTHVTQRGRKRNWKIHTRQSLGCVGTPHLYSDCYRVNHWYYVLKQTAKANDRCQKLDLESFLIMPVQRIPRYEMLLKVHPATALLLISFNTKFSTKLGFTEKHVEISCRLRWFG
jgi:hypothetical protein